MKLKHNANRVTLAGKRVILVDDSIVRGTTSTKIVDMVRAAGAAEVHMRIASPPTTHSCFYGVDTPERSKLLAARHSVEEMARDHRRRQPGLPLDRRPLPRGRRGAARRRACRNTATPASPATTRPGSPDIEGELGGGQLSFMLEDA